MRVVVQRVKEASCYVNNEIVGKIGNGLMLLVSFTHTDTIENVKKMIPFKVVLTKKIIF